MTHDEDTQHDFCGDIRMHVVWLLSLVFALIFFRLSIGTLSPWAPSYHFKFSSSAAGCACHARASVAFTFEFFRL